MKLWAQLIASALTVGCFIISLVPRNYDHRYHAGGNIRIHPWPRLRKFPIFWLGLLFLSYTILQAFNPAWQFTQSTEGWWMQQIEYIKWLPHSVTAPFYWVNPWRSLLIYASAWMLICAIWVGTTRRRTLLNILLCLAVNAAIMALYIGYQKLNEQDTIYGMISIPNPEFLGSFFYRNHGAAWLNLMVSIALALAGWYHVRDLSRFEKSSPSLFLVFIALTITIMVFISNSRGGILTLSFLLVLFITSFVIRQLTLPQYPQRKYILSLVVFLFLTLSILGIRRLEDGSTIRRMESLLKGADISITSRTQARLATIDMWEDSLWLGHGAGSFRYIFPLYQQRYPDIWTITRKQGTEYYKSRLLWEYAHNDIAQLFAEYGIIGASILAACVYWFCYQLFRQHAWTNPAASTLLLGLFAIFLYSWWDFVFQCPAILLCWCSLWPITLRWCELDRNRSNTIA